MVADSARQYLRALVVVDLLQEGGAVQEEALDLAEDEEGHCVVVEILQEVLWQRYLEELPENPRHLICPRIQPTPLGTDGISSLAGQRADQAAPPCHLWVSHIPQVPPLGSHVAPILLLEICMSFLEIRLEWCLKGVGGAQTRQSRTCRHQFEGRGRSSARVSEQRRCMSGLHLYIHS